VDNNWNGNIFGRPVVIIDWCNSIANAVVIGIDIVFPSMLASGLYTICMTNLMDNFGILQTVQKSRSFS
jgi:hypothetical protein